MSDISTPRFGRRAKFSLAAAALLVIGGGAGAVINAESRPSVTMAPVTPIAIRSLADDSIVTVRGRVAEVYGNKFVVADASGRALVDTGRGGEGGTLVTAGQAVTVQGRFDDGFIHATFLVGADSKIVALGPIGGGRHGGPDGPGGPGGPRRGHGPDRGPGDDGPGGPQDGPPAPPPAAPTAAAPTARAASE